MIAWGKYSILRPLPETNYLSTQKSEAHKTLKALLEERSTRYKKLETLLESNGLNLGEDTHTLTAMSEFFCENAPPCPKSIEKDPLWRELLVDFSLYLGDVITRKIETTDVRWGVKNVALRGGTPRYRAVLIGFLSTQQYLDPQYFLEMLSYQKSVDEELDLDLLNSLVEYSKLL